MGFALRHPWARGALNFAWHGVTRAAGTRADPMPTPPAGDIYVHYACHADPEDTPYKMKIYRTHVAVETDRCPSVKGWRSAPSR